MAEWRVVAGFQLRELLQRKLLWLLAPGSALAVGLFALVIRTGVAEPGTPQVLVISGLLQVLRLMLICSCLLISVVGSFAAIVTAGFDMESGRIQMVISRKVERQGVFLGHFLGLGAAVASYAALFYLAILLTFGWASGLWPAYWWAVFPVYTLAPLVQLALTLWLSAESGPVGAGIGALLLLLFTWMADLLETAGHATHLAKLELSGVMLSLLLPGASLNGWVTSYMRQGLVKPGLIQVGFDVGADPSGWMLLYGLLYLAGIIWVGTRAFQRREF